MASSTSRTLDDAVRKAQNQSQGEGAWTLRHAFDSLLKDRSPYFSTPRGQLIHRLIRLAINKGSSQYNSGDRNGCYRTYRSVAIICQEICDVDGFERLFTIIMDTLPHWSDQSDKAWILRHGLDYVLGSSDTHTFLGSVQQKICRESLKKGLERWNKKDPQGCASYYKRALENVFGVTGFLKPSAGLEEILRKALNVAQNQGPRDGSWTMRYVLDGLAGHSAFPKDYYPTLRNALTKASNEYNLGHYDACFRAYVTGTQELLDLATGRKPSSHSMNSSHSHSNPWDQKQHPQQDLPAKATSTTSMSSSSSGVSNPYAIPSASSFQNYPSYPQQQPQQPYPFAPAPPPYFAPQNSNQPPVPFPQAPPPFPQSSFGNNAPPSFAPPSYGNNAPPSSFGTNAPPSYDTNAPPPPYDPFGFGQSGNASNSGSQPPPVPFPNANPPDSFPSFGDFSGFAPPPPSDLNPPPYNPFG